MHQEKITLSITQNEENFKKTEKLFIWKNLFLICFSTFFISMGLNTIMFSLQSNIVKDEALTFASTIATFSAYCMFALFLPQLMLNYLQFKWALLFAFILQLLYILFNGKYISFKDLNFNN